MAEITATITPGATTVSLAAFSRDATKFRGRDVSLTAPTNGQVLAWNAALSTWEPTADITGATSLGGLSDATVAAPAVRDGLMYDGISAFVNRPLVEADISDLGSYAAAVHTHPAADVVSGTLADARIAQSNVTQYEAALAILETQIPDGSLLARLADAETVTGVWTFAANLNVAGATDAQILVHDGSTFVPTNRIEGDTSTAPLLVFDDPAALGETVHLQWERGALRGQLGTWAGVMWIGADANPFRIGTKTSGTVSVHASGVTQILVTGTEVEVCRGQVPLYIGWSKALAYVRFSPTVLEFGPGSGVWDTNLYRSAADLLKTDDDFEVGGDVTIATGQLNIGTGAYFDQPTNTQIRMVSNGSETARFGFGIMRLGPTVLGWGSAFNANDVELVRDAADTLALRRGTNAQVLHVYNTYTDASNYERAIVSWSANVFRFGTQRSGTGVSRAVVIQIGGADKWRFDTTGHFRPTTGNQDLGLVGNAARDIYLDGGVQFTDGAGTADTNLYRASAGVLKTDSDLVIGVPDVAGAHDLTIGRSVAGEDPRIMFYNSANNLRWWMGTDSADILSFKIGLGVFGTGELLRFDVGGAANFSSATVRFSGFPIAMSNTFRLTDALLAITRDGNNFRIDSFEHTVFRDTRTDRDNFRLSDVFALEFSDGGVSPVWDVSMARAAAGLLRMNADMIIGFTSTSLGTGTRKLIIGSPDAVTSNTNYGSLVLSNLSNSGGAYLGAIEFLSDTGDYKASQIRTILTAGGAGVGKADIIFEQIDGGSGTLAERFRFVSDGTFNLGKINGTTSGRMTIYDSGAGSKDPLSLANMNTDLFATSSLRWIGVSFSGAPATTGEIYADRYDRTTGAVRSRLVFGTCDSAIDSTFWMRLSDLGVLEFSDGASAWDTNLYRTSADILKTDDRFEALMFRANAGISGVVDQAADLLQMHNAGNSTFGFYCPNNSKGRLHFGDPQDSSIGRIIYDHNVDELQLWAAATEYVTLDATGIGFFGSAPVAKPTVTGSRAGNAALADLLTELASLGLITDSSTA